jgi:ABC-type branched-subunit amino acid transport system ATPase component
VTSPGFAVPEELLKPTTSGDHGPRPRLTAIDGARGASAVLFMSCFMVTDVGLLFVAFAVGIVLAGAVVGPAVIRALPADLRRTTISRIAASAAAGVLAGIVLASAVDEAQGRGWVHALAIAGVVAGVALTVTARRLAASLDVAVAPTAPQGGVALQVSDLDFAYGRHQVLFGVSLSVREGEIAALLGTNGAGKSTILRAVAGLDRPTSGTIRLFGDDTTYRDADDAVRRGVALLAGGRMTFPSLTVDENLRVGAYTLKGARLDEVYERFPALASRRQQRAGTLSGGEQQMLALGRVLLLQPRLLLIDELTLGLAPKVVEELIGTVREINAQGTTVLLVEQSVNLALTLASRSFFLERGQVRFDGPTEELLRRDDLLRPVFLADAGA